MHDMREEEQHRRGNPRPHGTLPVGHILFGGVFGLFVALLLNAGVVLHEAETKPSTTPKVPAALFRPVAWVSDTFFFDQPRDLADRALGRERFDDVFELPTAAAGDTTSDTLDSGDDEPVEAATATTIPPTTTTTAPPVLRASVDDRITTWVGGDSMSQTFGESLVRMLTETSVVHAVLDSRPSTGLTRPDFFDWPRQLNDVATGPSAPDVMVVVMGANDAQGITLANGDIFQFGEEGWDAEYRTRVRGVMQLLTADPNRRVIWVGQPAARDAAYGDRMNALNEMYRSEAEAFPFVDFVDARDVMSGGSGQYEAFLTDENGETFDARQSDGFHLSRQGGDVMATAVLAAIQERVEFVVAPPTTLAPGTTIVAPSTSSPDTSAADG